MPLISKNHGAGNAFSLNSGEMRARRVVTPSSGIVRGKFPSRKNGRMVHHEGLLERDAFYLLEAIPAVVAYREQPITLHYPDGERLRRYTPDLELTLQDGEMIYVEIKPAEVAAKAEIAHKLNKIREHLARTDQRFLVLTDRVIRQQPRLDNLRWLYQRADRVPHNPPQRSFARALLDPFLPTTVEIAAAQLRSRGFDVFGLMLDGDLAWPDEELLSMLTMLQPEMTTRHIWLEDDIPQNSAGRIAPCTTHLQGRI